MSIYDSLQKSLKNGDKNNLIRSCQEAVHAQYPELKIRWVRIYGNRWSYISGSNPDISYTAQRLRLNDDYGVLIDNPEKLNPEELAELESTLKGVFNS